MFRFPCLEIKVHPAVARQRAPVVTCPRERLRKRCQKLQLLLKWSGQPCHLK